MCARFTLAAAEKEIAEAYGAKMQYEYIRNWNIAPTDETLVITADEPAIAQKMHFGLVPYFAKKIKFDLSTINSRDDKLMESSLWKPLVKNHKTCLILTTGFYEWKKHLEGNKQVSDPYFFGVKDRPLYSFAGLWSKRVDPDTKEAYYSFSVVTTEANRTVGEIHSIQRMPVILSKENEKLWLSKDVPVDDLLKLCQPFPDELMTRYPVSHRINSVSRKIKPNNDAELMQPMNSQ